MDNNNNKQQSSQQLTRQQPSGGARAQGALSQSEKISVKFNFAQVQKFVKFEFPRKISLIELRFTFSKILDIDLFGRQLQFVLAPKEGQLKVLDEIKALTDQGLVENEYEINVTLNEYGA